MGEAGQGHQFAYSAFLRREFPAPSPLVRRTLIPVVLAVAFSLTGCGGDEKPEATSTGTSESPSASPDPDTDGDGTPDSEDIYPDNALASVPQFVTITCSGDSLEPLATFNLDRVNTHWASVYKTSIDEPEDESGMSYSCSAEMRDNPTDAVSRDEQAILANAAAEDASDPVVEDYFEEDTSEEDPFRHVTIAYEQCAEFGNGWMKNKWPLGPNQAPEAERAMTLCPRHPQAAAIRKRIVAASVETKMRGEGRVFDDGTYRVGEQVKPGTYAVEDTSSCYWERLDANGEIIDNNFAQEALRVQATINASDYSFRSEGCGTWKPVG